ncbi:unnamed protein product [Prorocentrum cordatum]|uniref:Uncharacterized protein n=1 Tax=Prorocentrum cordatum TaxID=2364126 RepID=A0ABN9SYG4_9DINO|nr:unnamed protein product [Polarella glacialis]
MPRGAGAGWDQAPNAPNSWRYRTEARAAAEATRGICGSLPAAPRIEEEEKKKEEKEEEEDEKEEEEEDARARDAWSSDLLLCARPCPSLCRFSRSPRVTLQRAPVRNLLRLSANEGAPSAKTAQPAHCGAEAQ